MAAWGTFSESDDCYSVLKKDVKKMEKEMKCNMDLIENMQQAFEQCAKQCCMTSSSSEPPAHKNSSSKLPQHTQHTQQPQKTQHPQQPHMEECTCAGLTIRICHSKEPPKPAEKSSSSTKAATAAPEKKLIASVDLTGFHPDEVTAKLKERSIIVSARHEDCRDTDGKKQYCCKKYSNMFTLPPDVDDETIVCCLEDNTLKIKAACTGTQKESERCLPILSKC
uniref:Uncharacterized protein LOC117355087 n=1 Tax=Geotrypetes seraphini TaxID=260995 RepID=A0A6P8QQZ9_GEOSA|nr:uncharacterized protein LOC117355087 [Geotrypetes seraphini]XP_033788985.1 uncharacterized protein LOC117355087 [Geotrypetes seraphini]XP_033788986.1 uncharacterized protein LOC117355087 [Geotrypetes seraphini]XP_033788987.1 uncharacterized protein LOC117355087 [Geotrypetes seraphini]XP_033788989.1 uncharacterized protein LOC117355087 [Geotrypetes seraphini]XP_033788990.1 uncharacterized protein LOC117355087 [Geotrypetes seraphini]